MYVDQKVVLYNVDAAIKIRAAHFLLDFSTKSVWAAFVESWDSVYSSKPNNIQAGRGSFFRDDYFIIANGAHINVGKSKTVARSILGAVEGFL